MPGNAAKLARLLQVKESLMLSRIDEALKTPGITSLGSESSGMSCCFDTLACRMVSGIVSTLKRGMLIVLSFVAE